MGKEDGVFEILQVVILNGKLALQGAIGDPAMLVQHGDGLAEDLIERHSSSSVCGVTPQCASTAAYHTRTPAGVPWMAGGCKSPHKHLRVKQLSEGWRLDELVSLLPPLIPLPVRHPLGRFGS